MSEDDTRCNVKKLSKEVFPFLFMTFLRFCYGQYWLHCTVKLQNSELHCSCQLFFLVSIKCIFSIFLLSPVYCNIFFYNALQGSELRGLLRGRLCVLEKRNNLEFDDSPHHKGLLVQIDVWDSYKLWEHCNSCVTLMSPKPSWKWHSK